MDVSNITADADVASASAETSAGLLSFCAAAAADADSSANEQLCVRPEERSGLASTKYIKSFQGASSFEGAFLAQNSHAFNGTTY